MLTGSRFLFRRAVSALVAVPAVSALALVAACSSEADTDSGQGTTTTAPSECNEGAGTQHDGEPPAAAEAASAPEASELVFAVTRFEQGGFDYGEEGNPWKGYGFNLDATVSTELGDCTCKASSGAKPGNVFPDGQSGRDNNYGKVLVPMLVSLQPDFEVKTNAAVAAGEHSWLFRLQGVGAKTAYEGLAAQAFEAAALVDADGNDLTPALDGSDVWPIDGASLEGGELASPKLVFTDAYVVPRDDGGIVWVGRGQGSIRMRAGFSGDDLRGTIHDPVLVLPISADRTRIEHGMLGGTLDTEELVTEVGRISGFFVGLNGTSVCPPSGTFQSIAQQVRQASDMLPGGELDPSATCNRISIGIAFDAVIAQLGPVAPAEVLADSCAAK